MLFVKCAVGDYYYMVGGGVHVGYEVCEAGSPLALDNESFTLLIRTALISKALMSEKSIEPAFIVQQKSILMRQKILLSGGRTKTKL